MSAFAPPLVIVREGLFRIDREFLRGSGEECLLFEGDGGPGRNGRCSYEAFDPWLRFRASGSDLEVKEGGGSTRGEGDPFARLGELLEPYRRERAVNAPPFPEAAGYIGYGAAPWTLPVTGLKRDPLGLPDMAIGFYDSFLIRDGVERRTWLVSTGLPERGAAGVARARERLRVLRDRIVPVAADRAAVGAASRPKWRPAMEDGYRRSVDTVLRRIRDGQIYQANITRLFRARSERDPLDLYRDLARSNPAPYGGVLRYPDFSLLSSSPELFLRMEGGEVASSPIKGTRPRSDDPAEDRRLAAELVRSAKDRAEHTMIVDLVRNDLGKSCRYGSIRVDPMYELRSASAVHHLSSTVRGTLDTGRTFVDVMRGLFPGGSITGAPKKRSVEIIDEEEGEGRGPFYGAMGFCSFDERAVWNLLIRSAVVKGGEVAFRVGGGIVADSNAGEEWNELSWKGSRLFETFRGAEARAREDALR